MRFDYFGIIFSFPSENRRQKQLLLTRNRDILSC